MSLFAINLYKSFTRGGESNRLAEVGGIDPFLLTEELVEMAFIRKTQFFYYFRHTHAGEQQPVFNQPGFVGGNIILHGLAGLFLEITADITE